MPLSFLVMDVKSVSLYFDFFVFKTLNLGPRKAFEDNGDGLMVQSVAVRVRAARRNEQFAIDAKLRPCVPVNRMSSELPSGGACLFGISPLLFGWNVDAFLSDQSFESHDAMERASHALRNEYEPGGCNETFRTVLQGTRCVLGLASKRTMRAWEALGLGPIPIGGSIGAIDCHIGGRGGSCSEAAATIAYCPSGGCEFQICATNDTDVVTLNGQQLKSSTGSFPLFHEDVCTVGARVFVFMLPMKAPPVQKEPVPTN